jgi:hypothetical protein
MVVLLYAISLAVFRVGFGGFRSALPVLGGLAFSVLLPAIFVVLVPFNPFRGLLDRRPGRGQAASLLSESDRRTLSAFYDPRNRRLGMLLMLIASLVTLTAWWLYIRKLASQAGVTRSGRDVLAFFLIIGTPTSLWIGLFGVTFRIRRAWKELSIKGILWPISVSYPGPLREAVQTVLTGQLPAFLSDPSDVAAESELSARTPFPTEF